MGTPTKPLVRPLSPYMQYVNAKTIHTMGFSILHRITGIALSIGIVPLVYWLTSAAMGVESYARAQEVFASPWMQVLLIGWLFSFSYHFFNGIRHLVWDTGRGFEGSTPLITGYTVFVLSLIATALVVALVWMRGGAV